MAYRVYNGTDWDGILGTPSINATVSTTLTTSYVAGTAVTAPNTSDYVTGVLFFLATVPPSGDIEIEVRESSVTKLSGVALNADLQLGYNYIRFTTPYQFTTTGAGAYQARIKNTVTGGGALARESSSSNMLLMLTYDGSGALGATDNIFLCGFHDSGLTPQTLTLSGTSNSWGAGTERQMTSAQFRTIGAASHIGNGATLVYDTAADCKLKQYGSIYVTKNGLFDMRPGASSVSTLEFDNQTADGDFGILITASGIGGQAFTTGQTVSVVNTYASGVGTAANPIVTQTAHGFAVGDELVFGGGSDYLKNEIRYVISIPSSTSLVVSSTSGGAETALAETHTVGTHVGNLTRNSIIKNTTSTRGFWIFNSSSGADICDFSYTRMEYSNCLSGRALQLSASGHAANIDGMVVYNNSAQGRSSVIWGGSVEQTSSDIIMYNTRGANYTAQSGFSLASAINKTIDGIYHFGEPASTTNCGGVSIASTCTSNTIKNFHSYGANAQNGTSGYAIGVFGSGNTFENCTVNSARRQGIILDASTQNTFTDCDFGTQATNTIDILTSSNTLIEALFQDCNFGSATLISNYLNTLTGSSINFQNMDGNESKHHWYTNRGSFSSAGSGLADTTVRTAGSLSLAIKPEDSASGLTTTFKVPANPTSNVLVFGYLYRNANFSSGDLIVELFLPGTSFTDTPDDTVTLSTTTGQWLPWTLNAYYSGTNSRYATVRIRAKTATAGAYAFLDDLYDAGTDNKVAGLDLWDAGRISSIIVASDTSSIPETTRRAVWTDVDSYSSTQKGYMPDRLEEIASEQALPNLLIKDKLS